MTEKPTLEEALATARAAKQSLEQALEERQAAHQKGEEAAERLKAAEAVYHKAVSEFKVAAGVALDVFSMEKHSLYLWLTPKRIMEAVPCFQEPNFTAAAPTTGRPRNCSESSRC